MFSLHTGSLKKNWLYVRYIKYTYRHNKVHISKGEKNYIETVEKPK